MITNIRAMVVRLNEICGMDLYAIRHNTKKLFRIYTRLDYARDGVYGEKMICDWLSARNAYYFLAGMAVGMECKGKADASPGPHGVPEQA